MKLLFDENYHSAVIEGLRKRLLDADIVRVQEVGLTGQPDTVILDWAAQENRIVVSHDRNTMIDDAYERVRQGKNARFNHRQRKSADWRCDR